MKKNSGRRKSDGRRKKGRHRQPQPATQRAVAPPPGQGRGPIPYAAHLDAALASVDWPALAIVAVPLALMALMEPRHAEPQHTARSAAWQGDLAREAMPLVPDPASRVALAPPLPSPAPWRGELAREAMPLVPDARTHAAIAMAVPLPPAQSAVAAAEPPPMCMPERPKAPLAPSLSDFGRTLAAAARAQTDAFVIYNARYIHIAYPGGDTQPLYGVCTDVVVRAYRALGLDLQALVHASRLGRGDPSIDHRRVEVVRRFLARHGTSLPVSDFAEDYRPGDIVTYHRPEGRISQHHIAIVSDRIAPSGRPLIVHNRGWGPQIEDALFVDRITGHYRLSRAQIEAFERTRAPRVSDRRRRTADISTTARR